MSNEDNLEQIRSIIADQAEEDAKKQGAEQSVSGVIDGGGLAEGFLTVAEQAGEVAVEMVVDVVGSVIDGLLDS